MFYSNFNQNAKIQGSEDMKVLIVKRKNDSYADRSVMMIWNLISAKYNFPIEVGKIFVMGRVPDIGDTDAVGKFFKQYPQTITLGSDIYDIAEATKYYESLVAKGSEIGRAPLIDTLDKMYIEYEIRDIKRL